MARNDIKIASGGWGTREFSVDARDTSTVNPLLSGEAVKGRVGGGSNYLQPIETGEPECGTDIFVGIVQRDSTETATISGVCLVSLVGPGTILEGDATTSANIDTAVELAGLIFDNIAFDVSATSVYTIDEDQNGAIRTLPLVIVGGDTIRTRVFALVVNGSLVGGSQRGGLN